MYLSATLIIAALSFFVEATPTPPSGLAIPIAKRTQVRDANGVVDRAMLLDNIRHTTAKINHGFQAYHKNTDVRHPSAHSEKRSVGSEPLVHNGPYYWYGPISVGTPPKTFMVQFDTGSSDLIISGSTCDSSCHERSMLYDTSTSSTAQDLKQTFKAAFGNSTNIVTGTLYKDTVTVAGYTAKDQTLGSGNHFPENLNSTNFLPDGLFGLAFQGISVFNASPVFQTLAAQRVFPANSFGFYIANEGSELYLGGTNDKLHKNDFIYVPVTQEAYWQISLTGFYHRGRKISRVQEAVIDSGTTLMLGDSETVKTLYGRISGSAYLGSGLYSMPCSFDDNIAVRFGAARFPITPQTFNLGKVSKDSDLCVGGLAADDTIPFWILGDVFLQNVYTEFDVSNKRIGIAKLV